MNPEPYSTRRQFLTAGAVLATGAACGDSEAGFVSMYNGKDLTGWEGDPIFWSAQGEMIVGKHPGIPYNDFLTTEQEYGDFTMRFQIKLVNHTGNSGVQFRSIRMPGSMEMIGYQADVGETYWGCLYDESRRRVVLVQADQDEVNSHLKPNEWNDYEIHAQGPDVRLSINGNVTAEYHEEDPEIPLTGLIGLQIHSGPPIEVHWRNLRIKAI